jgi:hypothetical protein
VNLFFNYFIDGLDEDLNENDSVSLEEMMKKLKSNYNWNETKPVLDLASQNCSNMIIQASK